jgi:uncharacterized protein involved in exopolysaccharide biosynthesis
LEEIQQELSNIESLQSRDAQIKEMLFELLSKEYEVAKIEEARSMPTIQVLDAATVPERPMRHDTLKKSIIAGIAALIFGIFIAFAREYVTTVYRQL